MNRRPNLLDVGALVLIVFMVALVIALAVLLAGRPCLDCVILPRATGPAPIVVVTR